MNQGQLLQQGLLSAPLWTLLLTELRSNVFLSDPTVTELAARSPSGPAKALLMERECLLSQIDDALELGRAPSALPLSQGPLDLTSFLSDFGEAYARRFGADFSAKILICTDPNLPLVKACPERLGRLIDCAVRTVQKGAVPRPVELSLRTAPLPEASADKIQLCVACYGVPFPASLPQVEELIAEFVEGKCLRALHLFGVELCACLHALTMLGGYARVREYGSSQILLELLIPLETLGPTRITPVERALFLYTRDPALRATFDKIAKFHEMRLISVESVSEVPATASYVLDARQGADALLQEASRLGTAPRATLLLSENIRPRYQALATLGYRRFIAPTFVSGAILRSLAGIDDYRWPYMAPRESEDRSLRVLIVDDVPTARIVLRDYFEGLGHSVTEASDGAEFVLRLQRGELFDIIFCDLAMCHVDGAAAVRMVRTYEERLGQRTPIVLVSAYSAGEDSAGQGFDRVLTKPVKIEEVSALVRELVPPERAGTKPSEQFQIIDLDDLRHRCSGKAKTMIKVLESFIETAQPFLPGLCAAEARADQTSIVRIFHALKGLLRDAGAVTAAKRVEEIEQKLRTSNYRASEDLAPISSIVQDACGEAARIVTELKIREA